MSGIKYNVEVAYFSSGKIDAPIGKLQSASDAWMRGLDGKIGKLAGSFNGAFDSAAASLASGLAGAATVGAAAVAGAVGAAVKEGFGFASYTEDLVNGLGGTMAMVGDIPLDRGLRQAAKSAEHLRQLAIKLPGSFKDAANAFSYILPTGLGHGVSLDRLETMAATGVGAASSLGISQGVSGHELAALLEGRASGRMPLFSKLLGAEMSASEFNRLPFEKRFEKIESRFSKLGPAMDQFGGSFTGMTSAAKDQAQNVAKSFASPLFGSIKGELERGLAWFGQNEDAVHAWATRLGIRLDYAFHRGLDAIHRWSGPVMTFGHTLYAAMSRAFNVAGPYLDRLEGVALNFMNDPKALNKIGHTVGALAGLRAGTGALSFGANHIGEIGSALESVGVGAAEMAAMAPLAVAGVAGLALAAEGAMHALTDSSSAFHGLAVGQVGIIADHATHTSAELAHLNASTRGLRDAMGSLALAGVGSLATQIDWTVTAAAKLADTFGGLTDAGLKFGTWLRGQLGILGKDPPTDPIVRTLDDRGLFLKSMNAYAERETDDHSKIHPPVIQNHVRIQIRAEPNEDPQRFAERIPALIERVLVRREETARNNSFASVSALR